LRTIAPLSPEIINATLRPLTKLLAGTLTEDEKTQVFNDAFIGLLKKTIFNGYLNPIYLQALLKGYEFAKPFGDKIAADMKIFVNARFQQEVTVAFGADGSWLTTVGVEHKTVSAKIQSGFFQGWSAIAFWDYKVYCAGERGAAQFYNIPHHRTVSAGQGWGGGGGGCRSSSICSFSILAADRSSASRSSAGDRAGARSSPRRSARPTPNWTYACACPKSGRHGRAPPLVASPTESRPGGPTRNSARSWPSVRKPSSCWPGRMENLPGPGVW
jgi:hypothetical protein